MGYGRWKAVEKWDRDAGAVKKQAKNAGGVLRSRIGMLEGCGEVG